MSEEEKKAIEDLKNMIEKSRDLMEEEFYKLATIHNIQAVATVLNLIEKQQAEIEKKDNKIASKDKEIKTLKDFHNKHIKIIDLMTERLEDEELYVDVEGICLYGEDCHEDCKQCIIGYFTNKVEEGE